jgi:hypothetical protein
VQRAGITVAGRRQVFGAASFRIVRGLQKPAFGVGAHSRLVLWESDRRGSTERHLDVRIAHMPEVHADGKRRYKSGDFRNEEEKLADASV